MSHQCIGVLPNSCRNLITMGTPIMGTMYPLDPRAYSYPICLLVDLIYRSKGNNLIAFITCHMKLDPILHGVIQIEVKTFLKNTL